MGEIKKPTFIKLFPTTGKQPAIDINNRGLISGRLESGAYYYEDHFHNRNLLLEWATRVTTGVAGGAPTSDLNGVYELLTGVGAADEESLDWNDVFTFVNLQRPTMEVRLFVPVVDNDTNVFVGLVDTNTGNAMAELAVDIAANNFILLGFSHTIWTDTNWHLHCNTGGASTVDAGAAATAAWVVVRFEFITDTSVEWFINGVSQGTIATNIPTGNLQPMLFILSDAGAMALELDYFKIWQDRS